MNKVSRRHFLGLTSIMTLKSLTPGPSVLERNGVRAFRIRALSEAGHGDAARRLSKRFDDLTRGLVLEHRSVQAEYHLESGRMRVRDTVFGRTIEMPVGQAVVPAVEEAHFLYAEAVRLAVRMAPEEAYLVRALGDYYLAFRRYAQGVTCFSELMTEHSQHASLAFQLGILYDRSGLKQQAYDAFRLVNRLDPDDAVAMYNLGVVSAELHNRREAERWFLETLVRMPDMKTARVRLDRLRLGVIRSVEFRLEI